jgi:hypothetical protein
MEDLLPKKEISINKRLKVFNVIFEEFHNDVNCKAKFIKVKKFNEFINFQKQVNLNIKDILNQDLGFFNKIKLFKNYVELIRINASLNEENKDILFKYVKNLYYLTYEDDTQSEQIKGILEMKDGDIMNIVNLMLSGEDGEKVAEFVKEIAKELEDELDLNIDGLDNIDIQKLITNVLQGGDLNDQGLNEDSTKKLQNVIEVIKEKVKVKMTEGKIPIKEIKKLVGKLKNKFMK